MAQNYTNSPIMTYLSAVLLCQDFSLKTKYGIKSYPSRDTKLVELFYWETLEFPIHYITDIEWYSAPFICLTIPAEPKEVIVALAETRLSLAPSVRFDFVAGKGQGLNLLLQYDVHCCSSQKLVDIAISGTLGVKKNLTAETMSEHL